MKKICIILTAIFLLACASVDIKPSSYEPLGESQPIKKTRIFSIDYDKAVEVLAIFFAKNHFQVAADKAVGEFQLSARRDFYDRGYRSKINFNTPFLNLNVAECGNSFTSTNFAEIKVDVEHSGKSSAVTITSDFRGETQRNVHGTRTTAVPNGAGGFGLHTESTSGVEMVNISCESTGLIEGLVFDAIKEISNDKSSSQEGRFIRSSSIRDLLPPAIADSAGDVIHDKSSKLSWIWTECDCLSNPPSSGLISNNHLSPSERLKKDAEARWTDSAVFLSEINRTKVENINKWRQPTKEELSELASVVSEGFGLTHVGWFILSSFEADKSIAKKFLAFHGGKKSNLRYVVATDRPSSIVGRLD